MVFFGGPRKLLLPLILAGALASSAQAAHVLEGIDFKTGERTTLLREDPAKKGTIVIFMSAVCPCSTSHADEIKKLAKDFPDFQFVGVNSNAGESLENNKSYFSAFPFVVLRDEKSQLAIELKALKTPHAFLFAKNGDRLFQGGVSNSATFSKADRKFLREALEDVNAGREVRTPLARALGCAIERVTP